MSETYSEAAVKVVISGIKKGLYGEEGGKVLVQILNDVSKAAEELASNLETSKQFVRVGSENVGVAMNGAWGNPIFFGGCLGMLLTAAGKNIFNI